MIIVGQDKSIIVNFNTLEAIEIGKPEENDCLGTIYARLMSGYFYKIGEYKTEERANEVLSEIAIQYCKSKMANNSSMVLKEKNSSAYMPCYEMPEE